MSGSSSSSPMLGAGAATTLDPHYGSAGAVAGPLPGNTSAPLYHLNGPVRFQKPSCMSRTWNWVRDRQNVGLAFILGAGLMAAAYFGFYKNADAIGNAFSHHVGPAFSDHVGPWFSDHAGGLITGTVVALVVVGGGVILYKNRKPIKDHFDKDKWSWKWFGVEGMLVTIVAMTAILSLAAGLNHHGSFTSSNDLVGRGFSDYQGLLVGFGTLTLITVAAAYFHSRRHAYELSRQPIMGLDHNDSEQGNDAMLLGSQSYAYATQQPYGHGAGAGAVSSMYPAPANASDHPDVASLLQSAMSPVTDSSSTGSTVGHAAAAAEPDMR